jgi:hypothetical protein
VCGNCFLDFLSYLESVGMQNTQSDRNKKGTTTLWNIALNIIKVYNSLYTFYTAYAVNIITKYCFRLFSAASIPLGLVSFWKVLKRVESRNIRSYKLQFRDMKIVTLQILKICPMSQQVLRGGGGMWFPGKARIVTFPVELRCLE